MDFSILSLLIRCDRSFTHERIRSQSMSDTECMICSYVNAHNDCSQDDVANGLKMDKTTVGKAIGSLEKKIFISRRQDSKDRRRNLLRLTEAGKQKTLAVLNEQKAWLNEVFACLSAEEQRFYEECSRRLLASAEGILVKKKA